MRIVGIVVAMVLTGANVASSQTVVPATSDEPTLYSYCQRFQTLYTQIREQTVSPDSARAEFGSIMQGLQQRFLSQPTQFTRHDSTQRDSLTRTGYFNFPLRRYGPTAIGGTHGEGYRGNGFDLFDYNVRGSHPAQDIFISDRNQDTLDDRTDAPVDVVSVTGGLVLAIETGWTPGQEFRGGNWIWVYDPTMHGLFYYAHNNVVMVSPGQWVSGGQKLSEVGRTGLNAYKTRSPTHLHLMYLQLQPNGLPLPQNPYPWLLSARVCK